MADQLRMIFCPRCGTLNPRGSSECMNCGLKRWRLHWWTVWRGLVIFAVLIIVLTVVGR
jgi:ribosomal protein L40E